MNESTTWQDRIEISEEEARHVVGGGIGSPQEQAFNPVPERPKGLWIFRRV